MKRNIAVLLTMVMLLSVFSIGAFAENAKYPNASFDEKVTLNDLGEEMPIRRAVINLQDEDGPYTITRVRLRDMAFALKDTEAKFDIGFDEATKSILLTSGATYNQIDLDKRAIDLTDATIVPSIHKVLLDGKEVSLGSYTINGETYCSIGSLNKAFGKTLFIRNLEETGDTLISFVKNDIVEYTKEAFDAKVKEKEITLVFAGAPWCPWTLFNLEGLIPFQQYIDANKIDAQIIALVHDNQNYYKSDILREYQKKSPNPTEELKDYPFYTVGMIPATWDHISEIAGKQLKYLPSIFFMDNEGNLIEYIQGGDDEEEEEEEDDSDPVPYSYINLYEEIIKGLK